MNNATHGNPLNDKTSAPKKEVQDVVKAFLTLVSEGRHYEHFSELERSGFHVTPVHFYSPIPEVESLPDALWDTPLETVGIDFNDAVQVMLLTKQFPRFRNEYDQFSHEVCDSAFEFSFANGQFGGTDALALYCMIRHFRPELVLEIGSGYSTRLSLSAIRANETGRLICVEPFPDDADDPSRGALLREGASELTLLEDRVERLGPELFTRLRANDVLFIDSSHVAKIGSDVNFLFFEVLPRLAPGVLVHFHDIFLPGEYPRSWVKDEYRFWNEAYLLRAFLMFNAEFEVLHAGRYLNQKYPDLLRETFPNSPWWGGGSFWIRRNQPSTRSQGMDFDVAPTAQDE